ncbi:MULTISPECIES: cell wall metabolism sensor histidine kinase WalK [unclassified Pseudomonas]|uniref:sensor histidine kinase n=1 Tax=unclassified Pseudomonas TaxID=196821 RepID=UPI000BC7BC54|nr:MULTISPECIES: ATP-binding protein [unclassified Pseudomonas]PVZ13633.1 signal transduction histidine kinase [Pseudomonas sp. URIL14HWK12:I12]PVZ23939.1 signal transduction histidine kinase [Pseudomonas sp. URIL14HWK12:I10]PVZ33422.1 signal transduction histidine kinase [Pseudomonas sp. URIL14HWK12:I11]SNZ11503.1 Signal transduction histidine kinase [Pseudomonas sp. URIL14HWK12:I9]
MSWHRLWPGTLLGQLALIMAGGTLAIQLLSSSIWFDVRFAQILEAPVRLMAARSVALIRAGCEQPVAMPAHYTRRCSAEPPRTDLDARPGHRRINRLLQEALAYEMHETRAVRLADASLTDAAGQPVVWRSLFAPRSAWAHVGFAVQMADGRWLQIEGQEMQGWSGESTWVLLADYLLRVYALRLLAVLGICLIAARLCLRPLRRLASAAKALGSDLEQPPLAEEGPREVREASRAFNSMQRRLQAMVREQRHFLAAVSHDLRTPLTRLRLRIEKVADPEQRQRLGRNVREMDRMIGQVLDYLHSAEPPMMRPVAVRPLLVQLGAELASTAEPLPIEGSEVQVLGNEVLLQRAVQNLVVNALRYGRDVRIELRRVGAQVSIAVLDRGPGIPPAQLPGIEQPFVRGEASRNSGQGGYGLGLSIAARIATTHGGRLQLDNRQGGGLEAALWLPGLTQ